MTDRPNWHYDPPEKETPAAFPPDRMIQKAPIDDRGRVVRQNWSFDTPGPGEHVAPLPDAPVPVEQVGEKPQFSAEDLAYIDSSGGEVEPAPASAPAGAEPLADVDPEDLAGWRRQLKEGLRTPGELQRAYNLTDAELEAVKNPPKPMTRARIEKELAAISRVRREDLRAYRKDPAMQSRELELHAALEKLKTEPAAEAATPEGLAEIEAELKKIADARREDPRTYTDAMQARERELMQQRAGIDEAARQDVQLQSTVDAVRDGVDDPEAFESGFDKMFSALGAEAQEVVREALRSPAMEAARPASEEQMEVFRGVGEECAAVFDAWGQAAGRKYATAEYRFSTMIESMAERDAEAALGWFKSQPPAAKAAIVKALAG